MMCPVWQAYILIRSKYTNHIMDSLHGKSNMVIVYVVLCMPKISVFLSSSVFHPFVVQIGPWCAWSGRIASFLICGSLHKSCSWWSQCCMYSALAGRSLHHNKLLDVMSKCKPRQHTHSTRNIHALCHYLSMHMEHGDSDCLGWSILILSANAVGRHLHEIMRQHHAYLHMRMYINIVISPQALIPCNVCPLSCLHHPHTRRWRWAAPWHWHAWHHVVAAM